MMRGMLGTLALAAGLASWQAPGAPAGFADRTGPYLGEKPPGLAPAVFEQDGTIHGAARAGDLAAVRALIERDARLAGARDESGRTPLQVAAGSGRVDVASFLITRGADVTATDNNAWTPLHAAAAADQDELVRIREELLKVKTIEPDRVNAIVAEVRERYAAEVAEARANPPVPQVATTPGEK